MSHCGGREEETNETEKEEATVYFYQLDYEIHNLAR